MITETYYVVRKDGCYLLEYQTGVDGGHDYVTDWTWSTALSDATRMDRSEAEEYLEGAEPDATVQRVTVTTEDVGLRWEETISMIGLYDGRRLVSHISKEYPPEDGYMVFGYGFNGEHPEYPTIEEAKSAAEAAVRETWA